MSRRQPLDPNALKALNQMREEIAKDIELNNNILGDNESDIVNTQIQMGGKVGGNMTRKLVEMGEKNLINKD